MRPKLRAEHPVPLSPRREREARCPCLSPVSFSSRHAYQALDLSVRSFRSLSLHELWRSIAPRPLRPCSDVPRSSQNREKDQCDREETKQEVTDAGTGGGVGVCLQGHTFAGLRLGGLERQRHLRSTQKYSPRSRDLLNPTPNVGSATQRSGYHVSRTGRRLLPACVHLNQRRRENCPNAARKPRYNYDR
jgi:hypothetical protein